VSDASRRDAVVAPGLRSVTYCSDAAALAEDALRSHVEVRQANLNLKSNHLNLEGIRGGFKPTLQAFAELTNNRLSRPALGAGRCAARHRLSRRWLRQFAGGDFPPQLPGTTRPASRSTSLCATALRNPTAIVTQMFYAGATFSYVLLTSLSQTKQLNQIKTDESNHTKASQAKLSQIKLITQTRTKLN
jgi:hypothetical protein